MSSEYFPPSPINGISYFQPAEGFRIKGRDGKVDIGWEFPLPLESKSYEAAMQAGEPDYDQIGQGIYSALRKNPDCLYATDYARLLRDAYPHIIAEIGGEAIMLNAKEVETPYLDRKVNLLKILALLEPENSHLLREIGMTLMEKGGRIEASHHAVQSWYGAEKHLNRALKLAPDDIQTRYRLGEVHYMLGHYEDAAAVWEPLRTGLQGAELTVLEGRMAAIRNGETPRVPAVDYLTALSIAFEHHQQEEYYEAIAIMEDIMGDRLFCSQFPMTGICQFMEKCYRATNQPDKAESLKGGR